MSFGALGGILWSFTNWRGLLVAGAGLKILEEPHGKKLAAIVAKGVASVATSQSSSPRSASKKALRPAEVTTRRAAAWLGFSTVTINGW
jgi:hypothetical protein